MWTCGGAEKAQISESTECQLQLPHHERLAPAATSHFRPLVPTALVKERAVSGADSDLGSPRPRFQPVHRSDDGLAVNPEMPVEIADRAGLPEMLHPMRDRSVQIAGASPTCSYVEGAANDMV